MNLIRLIPAKGGSIWSFLTHFLRGGAFFLRVLEDGSPND